MQGSDTTEDLTKLFETIPLDPGPLSYQVPELTKDGTCSASKNLHHFDLSEVLFHTKENTQVAEQIRKLKTLLNQIAQKLQIEWIGVYFRVRPGILPPQNGSAEYLLKVAYIGSPSRAVFPLTEEFCKMSNNSFCALNATRRIIQNTDAYVGPYYVCDALVKAEYCAALFKDGFNTYDHKENQAPLDRVSGLIDAEAWRTDAFTPEVISELETLGSFVGKLFGTWEGAL